MKTPLPEVAANKLAELEGLRMEAEDAQRSAAQRINNMGAGADGRQIDWLNGVRQRQGTREGQLAGLVHAVRHWVNALPAHAVLEMAPPVQVTLDGETIGEAIERTRDEILAAQRHVADVKRAPLPKADQKKLVRSYVERLVQQRLQPQVRFDRHGQFDPTYVDSKHMDFLSIEDVVAVCALIDPDPLIARWEAVIDQQPEPPLSLSAAEKAEYIATLDARLDELERRDVALVDRARAGGSDILWRPNTSPPRYLGVVVKYQTAQQRSSPQVITFAA